MQVDVGRSGPLIGALGLPELIILAIIAVGLLWFVLKLVRSLPGITIAASRPPQESPQSGRESPAANFANSFCTKCGVALSEGVLFCGKCGEKRS